MKPPKKPKGVLASVIESLEGKVSRDMMKRLLSLQNQFDVGVWQEALRELDPSAIERLIDTTSIAGSAEELPFVEGLFEALRQSSRAALTEWSREKTSLYMPYGRPAPVKTLNAHELAPIAERTFSTSLPEWAQPVQTADLTIRFDAADEAALSWAKRRSAELITAVDDQTRAGIRAIIHEAMAQGIDADMTALRIQETLGLHPRWARAVTNYGRKQYARLIAEGLTPSNARAKAHELAMRYRDTLIQKRSLMISRTEIMTASNKGRELGWNVLAQEGLIAPETEKEWLTAPLGSRYGDPCDNCSSMRGVRVRFNQAFPNGYFTPPAHPHCRCTAKLVPPSRGLTEVTLD
jgi:hypothetical protein